MQFPEDEKKQLWIHENYEDSCRFNENMLENCSSRNPMDLEMSLKARDWLVEDILMKNDKMSMAASLECRVPFLSRELMEWCFTLPHEWKVGTSKQGFTTKRILREFSVNRLPREIICREKKGFPMPIYEWLPDQLNGWAKDILFHRGHLEDWFDMQEVKNIFDKAMQNNIVHQNHIFELITLALWKQKWD